MSDSRFKVAPYPIDLESIFSSEHTAQLISDLHTIRDYIRWLSSLFEALRVSDRLYFGHGTESAWDEAVALVLPTLCLPWGLTENDPNILNANLTLSEKHHCLERVRARIVDRQPLPYITGEAWFYGLPFFVDERVLIPRSPIAELIESRFAPWWPEDTEAEGVLDLCTGSGCLAICMALAFEEAEVDAIELSADAIEVAQTNIKRHDLEDRVRLIQSDLFDELLQKHGDQKKYDIIVSNPPYVGSLEMSTLPKEYQHEPAMALHAEQNGLRIVSRILSQAKQLLTPKGILVVEVGNTQPLVEEAFPELPFQWLEFEKGGYGVFLLEAKDL